MNIPKLSVFKSLFNSKETPYTLTILDVYERIKNGYSDLNKKIERLRAMDENSEEHRAMKNSLLAIMFNGTFNERNDNGLVEHSGLCVLDFDDYPDAATMNEERQRLINCPFVYLVFTSPGGKGLKVVIKIPKSNFIIRSMILSSSVNIHVGAFSVKSNPFSCSMDVNS